MNTILTLEDFSKAGLSATEIYTGIFVVEDFITSEELSVIQSQIDQISEEGWKKSYTESLLNFIRDQYGVTTMEEAQELGHDMHIDEKWVDKNATLAVPDVAMSISARLQEVFSDMPELDFQGIGSIQRQYEGVSLPYHVDSLSNPNVVFACVLYLNDDFTGGELHFPKIGITYVPKKRALIVFPSADEYLHGVLPVGPGPTRYALPAFVNKRS